MKHQNYLWKFMVMQGKKNAPRAHTAEWNVACVPTNVGIYFQEVLIDKKSCSVLRHHSFIVLEIGKDVCQNYTVKYGMIQIYAS